MKFTRVQDTAREAPAYLYELARIKSVCRCRRRRRRINFATAIILVTVCQRVRNGEMFYRVIIVTAHEDGILGARERERERGVAGRRRSRLYGHAPGGIFSSRKFSGSLKKTGTSAYIFLLFLSPPLLPLLREERTSDPEIPTRRCGYWTYFSAANWDERLVAEEGGEKFFMSGSCNNIMYDLRD